MDFIEGEIVTASGARLNLLRPDPESICLEDIATGISREGRYANQTARFYSVAEHSLHLARLVGADPWLRALALLHDASEAYLRDIPAPIKCIPGFAKYRAIEGALMDAVLTRFGLRGVTARVVDHLDKEIRGWEVWHLRGPGQRQTQIPCGNDNKGRNDKALVAAEGHPMDAWLGSPQCYEWPEARAMWLAETQAALRERGGPHAPAEFSPNQSAKSKSGVVVVAAG